MRISDWSSDVCSSDLDPIMEEAINIFPNTQIQVLTNGYLWYQYWPDGPNKMLWDVRLFLDRAPHSFRTEFAEASYIAASRDVMAEDSSIGESQQEGLLSGGLARVQYGENEFMLRHFARTLTDYIENRSEEHTSELQSLIRISY